MPVWGHGWHHETPEVHVASDPSIDLLDYLQKDGLDLAIYDDFQVEREHEKMIAYLPDS